LFDKVVNVAVGEMVVKGKSTKAKNPKSTSNSNVLTVENIKGVYIVQVKAAGKVVKTEKVSLR